MSRRIFVGLHISKSLRQRIEEYQKSLGGLRVRWIKPHNLHITLLPPWYTDDVAEAVHRVTKLEGKIGRIPVQFDKVTFGPHKNKRLIWALGKTPPELRNLHRSVRDLFSEQKKQRNFLLHLTVARFAPEKFKSFPYKKLQDQVMWSDTIDHLTVFESHLTREGAEYEVLGKIAL